MQRKLCKGVGLRVLPACYGQITGGGRKLSALFYAFFFFSPLASLFRLSNSDLWQVETAAAAARASVPLHCAGCATAGDKDVPSTEGSWQHASGGGDSK